jgi:peptidyl-prolyl cis-trans isomerase A (cyclophilin A)
MRNPRTIALAAAALLAAGACKKEAPPAPPAEPPPAPAAKVETPPPPAPPPAEPAPAAAPAAPAAEGAVPAAEAAPAKKGLLSPAKLDEQAPPKYKAKFTTTKGAFVLEVTRDWAPLGADRFYNLVKNGFFDGVKFFRVIKGFMVQFGISGDPKISAAWRDAEFKDDPVKQSNQRGTISFATKGPNTRTTQVFINYVDNSRLDGMGFSPFGKVVSGMDVLDQLFGEYGGAPSEQQPRIQDEGNAFLEREFPKLDAVKKAEIAR